MIVSRKNFFCQVGENKHLSFRQILSMRFWFCLWLKPTHIGLKVNNIVSFFKETFLDVSYKHAQKKSLVFTELIKTLAKIKLTEIFDYNYWYRSIQKQARISWRMIWCMWFIWEKMALKIYHYPTRDYNFSFSQLSRK